jgi:hypothetical protein
MRRRELISLFAGAAAWPIATRAQPQGIRRVGCLMPWPDSDPVARASVTAFANALGHLGWNDDRNGCREGRRKPVSQRTRRWRETRSPVAKGCFRFGGGKAGGRVTETTKGDPETVST